MLVGPIIKFLKGDGNVVRRGEHRYDGLHVRSIIMLLVPGHLFTCIRSIGSMDRVVGGSTGVSIVEVRDIGPKIFLQVLDPD